MNWNKDKSLLLTRICTALFAVLLLALDLGCCWAMRWFVKLRGLDGSSVRCFVATVYACSIFAWLLLWRLWMLLGNIRRGEVFTADNVSCLRAVSWCCAGAAAICLVSALYYPSFLMVAAAAGFMCLIVRVVKNVFQQAVAMKSELDLTI
ncbi:MAG: DUF2975 domain-containing protein [Oscillospiraceae bacterium]|nr:DUF2975 domain-containing protein [Oscillospiraceae bacterium]